MKIKNNEKSIYIFFWIIYALISLIAVLNHEPNRDEAQVWLIVRDLNLHGIFSQINMEGHPCLWYLILLPFVKAGFPYITMQLIHWLIAIIATRLFLFKAPLNKVFKIIFIFSYYMLFQYNVVARNYSIIILFLFLIATFYERRFTKPYLYALLLMALYNTHVLAFGGAFALTLIYFLEAKRNDELNKVKYALLIMLCGAVSVIVQLFPSSLSAGNSLIHASILPHFNIDTYWIVLTSIQNAFIPVDSQYEELKVALFFAIVLILFFISAIRKSHLFTFLLITFCWIFYVFTTIHSGSWKHEGLILIFIVFFLWISDYYSSKENKVSKVLSSIINFIYLEKSLLTIVSVCLFVNVIFGLNAVKKEYKLEFSGSKSMANYIINTNLQSKEIACYRSWRATAIAPYLPATKFWFLDRKEYGSYFILDSVFEKYGDAISEKEVIERTRGKYTNEALVLLNDSLSIQSDSSFSYQLLFKNEKLIWGTDDENYFLYKVNFKK